MSFMSPTELLKKHFGYDSFQNSQEEIVTNINKGRNGLAIMATGGGKSICFQLPALNMEGTAIIVSPLISLMKDQVDELEKINISASCVNGSLSAEENTKRMSKLKNGEYKLFYVSPERLTNNDFIESIAHLKIPYFAIDEAHCVSTWGHDFRNSFKQILPSIKTLEKIQDSKIPRVAFTATATPEVKEDIVKQLELTDNFFIQTSFDRPNLQINVRESNNKTEDLIALIEQHQDDPTIIYCATIKSIDKLSQQLQDMGINNSKYHGRMDNEERHKIQDDFISGKTNIMIATNAFGMGVNKSDIRMVIHYQMPGNIENYYQEIGRAGRDGKPSVSYMLYNKNDRKLQDFFISATFPERDQIESVRHYFAILNDGTPIGLNREQMLQALPVEVKPYQIDSILRVLSDQGVINLVKLEDQTAEPIIEINDITKEIDYEYLDQRRKISNNNLNMMVRFSTTRQCRRNFILKYFEEKSSQHCNNCDRCFSKNHVIDSQFDTIPHETVKSILSLVDDYSNKINISRLRDILIGLQKRKLLKLKFDQHKQFGSLKSYNSNHVYQFIESIINSEYIKNNHNNLLFITESGKKILHENVIPAVKAPLFMQHNKKREINRHIEEEVDEINYAKDKEYNELKELRDQLAENYRQPKFMILSDALIDKIIKDKPADIKKLNELGLSEMKVRKFGHQIIECLNKEQNSSFNPPF